MEIARLESQQPATVPGEQYPDSRPPGSAGDVVPVSELSVGDLYQILQADPFAAPMALRLAECLRRDGKIPEALQILERLVQIDNGFDSLFSLGLTQFQAEDLAAALRSLRHAALIAPEASPRLPELFKVLGSILVRSGDYDSAEEIFNKALRLEPESDVIQVNLGTLEIQRGDWSGALTRFRESVQLNARNDKAWVGLAICHRQFGDHELAWANLETALMHNPCNETALTLATDWAAREGREARLLEMLRDFLLADGWNVDLGLTFVWLSWVHGDRVAAELELDRILTMAPENEAAWQLREKLRMMK